MKEFEYKSKLYPLKFVPIIKEKIWGGNLLLNELGKSDASENTGESWEISGLDDDMSIVQNGIFAGVTLKYLLDEYKGNILGTKVYEQFGNNFPLLVKFIDASTDLSIQVHPDDETAKQFPKAHGKTEAWYVLDAKIGAKLISGFNKEVSKNEYLTKLKRKELQSILNFQEVEKGDFFFIKGGTVHAIGAGTLIAEIQQSSDTTFRIYDWERVDSNGERRELHTNEALKVIDITNTINYKIDYSKNIGTPTKIVKSEFFTVNNIQITKDLILDYSNLDSFVIFILVDGMLYLECGDETFVVTKGETILIPAIFDKLKLIPNKSAALLEVYI